MNPKRPTGAPSATMPRAGSRPAEDQPKKPSRRALEKAFLSALYENFSANGTTFLNSLLEKRPDCYLRAILLILPKETEKPVSATEALGGEDFEALLAGAKRRLAIYGGGGPDAAGLVGREPADEIPPVSETS
jgi:hypothetical protein